MLYEFRNLKKTYERRTVLDLETLYLERGRILVLRGPNGAGKTTLLEIMAFLSGPTSGEVWFCGQRVNFAGNNLMGLRRKVVLVQQQAILFTTTVSRNIEFPMQIRKTPRAARRRTIEELLDLVGMEAFRDARAHKLSGGETQRVAIAQALACCPEVILLDEPTASVDVENQIAIERIIREINRTKGISVVFTTHDMIQASRVADETVFLFEGKVAGSIYENIFSATMETDDRGSKYCVLQNGLRVRLQSKKSGRVRISIDPSRVSMGSSKTTHDNAFQGRLVQLSDEQSRVRALVDVGMLLNVLVPRQVFKGMDVGVGDDVWITCPTECIEVF
jgi:tungstate transport system ATP-binding protein